MASKRQYAYEALNDPEDIRLLVLEPELDPSRDEAPIKCFMIVTNLARQPLYQALSYTWESQYYKTSHKTIYVDGQPVDVKPNLWSALRHLRQSDRMRQRTDKGIARCLWIDAVCMNQESDTEKNQQVQLMGKIYSLATEVVVWLGPSADQSTAAMRLIQYPTLPQLSEEGCRDLELLHTFFSRQYWQRIWVIQEIILASRLTVYCGVDFIDWASISTFRFMYNDWARKTLACRIIKIDNDDTFGKPQGLQYSGPDNLALRNLILKIMISTTLRMVEERVFVHVRQRRLFDLVENFRHCLSSNPRDKVIALLSLASDCADGKLVLDYSKSTLHLFEDVLIYQRAKSPLSFDSEYTGRRESLILWANRLQRTLGITTNSLPNALEALRIGPQNQKSHWKLYYSFFGIIVKSLSFKPTAEPYRHFKKLHLSDLAPLYTSKEHEMSIRVVRKETAGLENEHEHTLPEDRTFWKDLPQHDTLQTSHYHVHGPSSPDFDAEWRSQNFGVFQCREFGQLNFQFGIAEHGFKIGDAIYYIRDTSDSFWVILREGGEMEYIGRTILLDSTTFSMGKGKMSVGEELTSEEFLERQKASNQSLQVMLSVDTLGLAHLTH